MPALVMRSRRQLLGRPTGWSSSGRSRYAAERRRAVGHLGVGVQRARPHLTYQYSPFGVPGLGLMRGLGRERWSSRRMPPALAAMVDPQPRRDNLRALAGVGRARPLRLLRGARLHAARGCRGRGASRSCALHGAPPGHDHRGARQRLLDGPDARRGSTPTPTSRRPSCCSRSARRGTSPVRPSAAPRRSTTARDGARARTAGVRRFTSAARRRAGRRTCSRPTAATPSWSQPRAAGYSRWSDLAVTRWRADVTRDDCGHASSTCATWRAGSLVGGYQPSRRSSRDSYEVTFTEDRAEFVRQRRLDLRRTLEVVVSPEDDAECGASAPHQRQRADARRSSCTSYAELVLGRRGDAAHPAFRSCSCRPSIDEDSAPCSPRAGPARRRARGLGRPDARGGGGRRGEGREHRSSRPTARASWGVAGSSPVAAAVIDGAPLSGHRRDRCWTRSSPPRRVTRARRREVLVAFWTVVGTVARGGLDARSTSTATPALDRRATLAWTQAQVAAPPPGRSSPTRPTLFQAWRPRIVPRPGAAASPSRSPQAAAAQSALWVHGHLRRPADRAGAHRRPRRTRARRASCCRRTSTGGSRARRRPGGPQRARRRPTPRSCSTSWSALRRPRAARPTLGAAGRRPCRPARRPARPRTPGRCWPWRARSTSSAARGDLADQLDRACSAPNAREPDTRPRRRSCRRTRRSPRRRRRRSCEFFNGLGGFAADGSRVRRHARRRRPTPAPVVNVIANGGFGFHVSAEGAATPGARNSRDNQLTPWSQRPGQRPPRRGVLRARRGHRRAVVARRPQPIRARRAPTSPARPRLQPLRARRARPRARADASSSPLDDPVKISRLTIRNTSGAPRRLSVTSYAEWVLGVDRAARRRRTSSPRSTPRPARCSRATRGAPPSPTGSPSLDLGGRQTHRYRRPPRVPWPQRYARRPGRRCAGRAAVRAVGRRPRPLRGAAAHRRVRRRARTRRGHRPPRRGRPRGRAARAARALPRRRSRRRSCDERQRHWTRPLGTVQVHTPDPALRRHDEPLAALPDARLPHAGRGRLLPGERRVRLPRPAPGRDGAVRRGPATWRASTCCAPRPAVRGGRRPALVAARHRPGRAHPDQRRPLWLAYAAARYVERHRRHGGARRDGAVPRRAAARGRRARRLLPARATRTRRATLYEHCARALDQRHRAAAPTACRSSAPATGTTA